MSRPNNTGDTSEKGNKKEMLQFATVAHAM
jgi:hypothetical protein